MTLLARLLEDHAAFRALGRALESQVHAPAGTQDPVEIRRLAGEFKSRLDTHSEVEDRVFYPAVAAVLDPQARVNAAYMNHLDNEHRKIDVYLTQMLEQVNGPELMAGWGQSFALFSIGLRTHMRKEEEELFPEAERLLGAVRMAALGR